MKNSLRETIALDASSIQYAVSSGDSAFHHKLFYDGLRPIMLRYVSSIPTGRALSPVEIGSLAVSSSMESMNSPISKLPEEIGKWELTLQEYLGEDFSLRMAEFYRDLIPRIRTDHSKLLGVLKNYPSQVYLLSIAFDSLHNNIVNATLPEKVIFGLVCVELMKAGIRPYFVSKKMPVNGDAYTDWMSIIDHCFGDFLDDMSRDSAYVELLPLIAYIRVNRDIWSSVKSQVCAKRFEQKYAGDAFIVAQNVIRKAQGGTSSLLG